MTNPLTNDWGQWLGDEFQADYMKALKQFLAQEKTAEKSYLSPLFQLVSGV